MSMPNEEVRCTRCDFRGVIVRRPITLIYHLVDGQKINSYRITGWCYDCSNISDVEPIFSKSQIECRLDELREEERKHKSWLSIFNRASGVENKKAIDELEGKLKVAQRRSLPRCLHCGGQNTQPLSFNDDGISINFTHDCGGRLELLPTDPEAPRMMYRPIQMDLDVEGNLIDSR